MFAIQSATRRAPQLMSLARTQQRTIVSTPPTVRVPFIEKVLLGVAMYVGIMAVPIYISTNLKHYKKSQ